VTPTDYAVEELAIWEQALRTQREAETEFDEARRERRPQRVIELMPQLQALRTRTDLLLAEAVKAKCSFTEQKIVRAWAGSTQPGALHDETTE
jgi:hypothetical protein